MTEEALWAEYGRHIRLSALIKDEIERKQTLRAELQQKAGVVIIIRASRVITRRNNKWQQKNPEPASSKTRRRY
jgi:hypothetical protein